MQFRRIFLLVAVLGAILAPGISLAENYVGLSGSMLLPAGGSGLKRVGGAALRAGHYFNDDLALEAEAAWLEDTAALAVRGLWHWQGCRLYSDFFGYSRFDPFFTLGASGWLPRRGRGQVGPEAGVGAFYHLTDSWALRADGRVTLGLDSRVEADFSLSVGVQYSF